jgi:hypothetical protein
MDLPMRFEDLPPAARTEAARAAREFMRKNGYISLMEACEALDLASLQELWDRIMAEAGLPACEAPAFAAFV